MAFLFYFVFVFLCFFLTCVFLLLSGLPYFSPDLFATMSQNAYASSLKTLGGEFRTRGNSSAGGSGFAGNLEDGAESVTPAAWTNVVPEPVVTNEVVVPEYNQDASEDLERPRGKRLRTIRKKPPPPRLSECAYGGGG